MKTSPQPDMQQRPHSEGRVSSPPPPSHQRLANRHRKTSALSKSCVLVSESSSDNANYEHTGNGDGDDDVTASSFSSLSELERKTKRGDSGGYDRHPRRPKTTPKPRIERLLVGPGKNHIQEAHASSSSSLSPVGAAASASSSQLFFMTHLPDSPPRLSHSNASIPFASGSASSSDDDEDRRKSRKPTGKISSTLGAIKASSGDGSTPVSHNEVDQETAVDEPKQPEPQLFVEKLEARLESSECDEDLDDAEEFSVAPDRLADIQAPATSVVSKEDQSEPALALPDKLDGPLQVDLLSSSATSSASAQPQLDSSDEEDDMHDPEELEEDEELTQARGDTVSVDVQMNGQHDNDNEDDGSEYSRSMATRRRMQQEDRHREQMRGELESYVALLTSRKGEDGAQLVEFPRNYQQVLSLMSERDVREEDSVTTTTSGTNSGASTQRSWSHVLLQAGLSKQQAFGALNEEDEASGGEGGMAAKIALKMARVRQLDAVLEEKLGKNLYSSSAATTTSSKIVKKPKAAAPDRSHFPPSPSSNQHSNSAGSVADSLTSSLLLGANGKSGNFVERNRKVIAHGMKAVLSRDEESRLSRLLRDLGSSDSVATESEATPATISDVQSPASLVPRNLTSLESLGRNEFEMDAQDKRQIEELLAAKCGVYQSTLLPPAPPEINDFGFVIDDQADRDLSSTPGAYKSKSAFNVIQATKSERLRKQRLERIELEIQFLKENEHMAIVANDGDENDEIGSLSSGGGGFEYDDNSDIVSILDGGGSSTMSERSFRTTASSVCSTRSGVISRRHFNQFLELEKQDFDPQSKASDDDIRRLVASLSHLRMTPRTMTTAMSSRPVA